MKKKQVVTGILCLMLLCGCAAKDDANTKPGDVSMKETVENTETTDAATEEYSSISISKEPLTPLLGEEHSHPNQKHYETLPYNWEKTTFKRSSEGGKEYATVTYQGKEITLVVTPDAPTWLEIGNDFIDYGFLGVADDGSQYYISLYTKAGEDDTTLTDIMIANIVDQKHEQK